MLLGLIFIHGDLVAFSSSRVGPEILLPGHAHIAGSLNHSLSGKGMGYGIMKQCLLCVHMRGSKVQP